MIMDTSAHDAVIFSSANFKSLICVKIVSKIYISKRGVIIINSIIIIQTYNSDEQIKF